MDPAARGGPQGGQDGGGQVGCSPGADSVDPGETIVSLSSPPGAAPTAVVRLAGPRALELAREVFPALSERGFRRVEGSLTLPGWPPAPAAALTFRAPRSYTGDDLVELQPPGAPPLVARLLLHLQARGARQARPGEFSRRAFLNGRLDLTQAEAILALTQSEDAAAARAAARALAGGLRPRIDALKAEIVGVIAHVEAAIDFSEEELDLAADQALADRLEAIATRLDPLAARETRLAGGAEAVVALRGPANAGKSSLLNALCGAEVALVSATAGTTRDVVAATWRLPSGRAVRLLDTAGDLHTADPATLDPVDVAAQALATDHASAADLVLYVVDGRDPRPQRAAFTALTAPALLVLNKADLGQAPAWAGVAPLRVSASSGAGLDALAAAVERRLDAPGGRIPDLLGSARQAGLLAQAATALRQAATTLTSGDAARAELAALDLSEALEALGQLTGVVTTDDVLDQIFGAFCIGK